MHWDTIIVGAGSAGAALAYRLSENPNRRVLLLEAVRRKENEHLGYAAGGLGMEPAMRRSIANGYEAFRAGCWKGEDRSMIEGPLPTPI